MSSACFAASFLFFCLLANGTFAAEADAPDALAPAADIAPARSENASLEEIADVPERIARLERNIKNDEERLAELKRELDDPRSEYAEAETAFQELDDILALEKKSLIEAMEAMDPISVKILEDEIAELEKKWSLAKKSFQLAIDERKAQLAGIANLAAKVENSNYALDRIRGIPLPTPPADPAPHSTATAERAPAEAPPATSSEMNLAPIPWLPSSATADTAPANKSPKNEATLGPVAARAHAPKAKTDARLVAAEKTAAEAEAAAARAERIAEHITERLEMLQQDIELQRRLRKVAEGKNDISRDQLTQLNNELEHALAAGNDPKDLRRSIREVEDQIHTHQTESREISERIDELQIELIAVQRDQVAAMKSAHAKRTQAELARVEVQTLANPFSWHNMWDWANSHGRSIFYVCGFVSILLWVGHLLESRVVALFTCRGLRGSQDERVNRAKTLVSVLHNAFRSVAIGGATVIIFDELGVPVGPILGGAAVVGVAVAFGAQSLIKDCFTGFMVLTEQQYMINDVIQIGETSGQVERITLRMTVLRDLEGRVHFIPHGQINTVTNLTHGWSRALFDVRVSYKEDADQVMGELLHLAAELRRDAKFGPMIMEDAEMLGVDELTDAAVHIKFFMRTKPLQQWNVKREFLRRMKQRFDEMGIELAHSSRTVYIREVPEPAPQLRRLSA